MDGRGRCHDNIFVERLWWTVKHEWVYLRPAANASNRSAAWPSSSTGIICAVPIRRSAGEPRTRRTSANRQLRRHWPPDAMPRRCCEFVDSRLRRSPPHRAGAVPDGQAGENAMRFPHLAHRSAAAHKLHSTTTTTGMNLIPGKLNHQPATSLSLFFPEAVQTTGTVAMCIQASEHPLYNRGRCANLIPRSPHRNVAIIALDYQGNVVSK
jgi:hypothetical protein